MKLIVVFLFSIAHPSTSAEMRKTRSSTISWSCQLAGGGDISQLSWKDNRTVTSIKDTGAAAFSSDFRFSNGTNNTYTYTYDAGRTTTDYTGNLVLENETRSRLLFDGGYVSLSDNAYHFFLTDHLGSVRVVASTSGTAEEYNHYYPLGGLIAQYSSSTSLQPIKFQGKEWGAGKGLDLYDFGARRYDPAIGRWLSQDPLAEKYYRHSPYLFCAANPVRFVDPMGMIWYSVDPEGHITVVDSEKNGPDRL